MAEAESIINSCPLTPILLNPDANEPLMPSHLLLMRSSFSALDWFKDTDRYSRNRWCQVQYLLFNFGFASAMNIFTGRQRSERNFAVNDLVLLHDDRAPRGSWPLRRVVKVYPDAQKKVRQVKKGLDFDTGSTTAN